MGDCLWWTEVAIVGNVALNAMTSGLAMLDSDLACIIGDVLRFQLSLSKQQ